VGGIQGSWSGVTLLGEKEKKTHSNLTRMIETKGQKAKKLRGDVKTGETTDLQERAERQKGKKGNRERI